MRNIPIFLIYIFSIIILFIAISLALFLPGFDIVDFFIGPKETKLSQACDYYRYTENMIKDDIECGRIRESEVPYLLQKHISEEKEAKLLISQSIPEEIEKFNRNGKNALTNAISRGHLELVKQMLKKGARVNLGNSEGETPLYFSVRHAQPEIAKYLLENGAEIDTKNDSRLLYLLGPYCYKGIPEEYKEHLLLLLRNGAGCEMKPAGYSEVSVTKADFDTYLKKYNQIRDYKEREVWLLSCLKKGQKLSRNREGFFFTTKEDINIKDELVRLYMNRAESYLELANDNKSALQEYERALEFAEDKKLLTEIRNKITETKALTDKAQVSDKMAKKSEDKK